MASHHRRLLVIATLAAFILSATFAFAGPTGRTRASATPSVKQALTPDQMEF